MQSNWPHLARLTLDALRPGPAPSDPGRLPADIAAGWLQDTVATFWRENEFGPDLDSALLLIAAREEEAAARVRRLADQARATARDAARALVAGPGLVPTWDLPAGALHVITPAGWSGPGAAVDVARAPAGHPVHQCRPEIGWPLVRAGGHVLEAALLGQLIDRQRVQAAYPLERARHLTLGLREVQLQQERDARVARETEERLRLERERWTPEGQRREALQREAALRQQVGELAAGAAQNAATAARLQGLERELAALKGAAEVRP